MGIPEGLIPMVEHDPEVLDAIRGMRLKLEQLSGLTAREIELARLAALVAIDAPPDAIRWHVDAALAGGATRAELWGVLKAVAPVIGVTRLVAGSAKVGAALAHG